jgi:hypothetical protein
MNDERYKELMAQCGMPDSRSVLQALQQANMEGYLDGKKDSQLDTKKTDERLPAAYRYRINDTHTMYSEYLPPDDAYDDGTLVPLYEGKAVNKLTFESWLASRHMNGIYIGDLRAAWDAATQAAE